MKYWLRLKVFRDSTDIRVDYEPQNNLVKITDRKSNISQVLAQLPEDALKYELRDVDYLNGIIRVRLS